MSVDKSVYKLQCLICDETWDAIGRWCATASGKGYVWKPLEKEKSCPECGCTEVTRI